MKRAKTEKRARTAARVKNTAQAKKAARAKKATRAKSAKPERTNELAKTTKRGTSAMSAPATGRARRSSHAGGRLTWAQFAAASPELAALGEERIEKHGLILLGTLRRDGSPRISPVEPLIVDGELELGMMWRSTKALDLLRDPRCHVHTIITDRNGTEGEFKLWGHARDLPLAERGRYCDALEAKIGWRPKEPFHCFAIEIESAAYRIFGAGAPGKVRALVWRAGGATVESETSHPV